MSQAEKLSRYSPTGSLQPADPASRAVLSPAAVVVAAAVAQGACGRSATSLQ